MNSKYTTKKIALALLLSLFCVGQSTALMAMDSQDQDKKSKSDLEEQSLQLATTNSDWTSVIQNIIAVLPTATATFYPAITEFGSKYLTSSQRYTAYGLPAEAVGISTKTNKSNLIPSLELIKYALLLSGALKGGFALYNNKDLIINKYNEGKEFVINTYNHPALNLVTVPTSYAFQVLKNHSKTTKSAAQTYMAIEGIIALLYTKKIPTSNLRCSLLAISVLLQFLPNDLLEKIAQQVNNIEANQAKNQAEIKDLFSGVNVKVADIKKELAEGFKEQKKQIKESESAVTDQINAAQIKNEQKIDSLTSTVQEGFATNNANIQKSKEELLSVVEDLIEKIESQKEQLEKQQETLTALPTSSTIGQLLAQNNQEIFRHSDKTATNFFNELKLMHQNSQITQDNILDCIKKLTNIVEENDILINEYTGNEKYKNLEEQVNSIKISKNTPTQTKNLEKVAVIVKQNKENQ